MPGKRNRDDDERIESGATDASAKSNNSTMLLVLAGGGVLLLCCACGGVGIGGWLLHDSFGFGGSVAERKDTEQPRVDDKSKGDGPPNKGDGAAAKWKEVRSENGKFVVDLPPNATSDKSKTGGVADLFIQVAGSTKNHLIYVASTKRVGSAASEPAKTVAENNAQVPQYKNKTSISLQGHPGVERRSDDGKTVYRCYVSGSRVYIITIVAQGGGFDQSLADRVFNSFRILD